VNGCSAASKIQKYERGSIRRSTQDKYKRQGPKEHLYGARSAFSFDSLLCSSSTYDLTLASSIPSHIWIRTDPVTVRVASRSARTHSTEPDRGKRLSNEEVDGSLGNRPPRRSQNPTMTRWTGRGIDDEIASWWKGNYRTPEEFRPVALTLLVAVPPLRSLSDGPANSRISSRNNLSERSASPTQRRSAISRSVGKHLQIYRARIISNMPSGMVAAASFLNSTISNTTS
jgi:hypothetical protein